MDVELDINFLEATTMDFDAMIDLLNQPPTCQDASTSTNTQEDQNAVNRADGAAAGLLAGVARFKKRSITIKV